jgi:type I restriction-modification system DNA methylase subunit
MNERITEQLVREILAQKQYNKSHGILVEEQRSQNPGIDKLLKNASKRGNGIGLPEFIITSDKYPNLVIVFECKADTKRHESKDRDLYADYAVDGVRNYACHLSKRYDVVAIAVSGQSEKDLVITNHIWPKGASESTDLPDKCVLTMDEYNDIMSRDPQKEQLQYSELMQFSKELHNYMRDHAKLSETEKPLLVSGILIALYDEPFVRGYEYHAKANDLAESIVNTIRLVLTRSNIPESKIKNVIQVYSFIQTHPELNKGKVLLEITKMIDEHVKPFMTAKNNIDVVGQFYGEFLRYTGGDKKGLGIVLTPRHVTELFTDMANLTTSSVVLDTCTGTGGFLIAAMHDMVKKAGNDTDKIQQIKRNNLIGVEQQPNMFALATSNMILRGDGKSNLYLGSCFSFTEELQRRKPTVGLMNPPYSQRGEGLSELDFIGHMLECLEPNSLCFAIVPMSCAISPNPIRAKLLENHTLEAVMSMPDDLFYPVGVVTCIMVFRAKVPHSPYHESWFGYWKNDGYVKTKVDGRVDLNQKWAEIKEKWLDMYFGRKEIPGFSVRKKVTANDEWCAEAYMETDYSDIRPEDFEKEMQKYVLFTVINHNGPSLGGDDDDFI